MRLFRIASGTGIRIQGELGFSHIFDKDRILQVFFKEDLYGGNSIVAIKQAICTFRFIEKGVVVTMPESRTFPRSEDR